MRLGEFELIERLLKELPPPSKEVVIPAGDDTAVVEIGKGKYQLLTTDALVEGSHFKLKWKEVLEDLFFLLGKKLVNVCASDIASTGGIPKLALINLGTPKEIGEKYLIEIYRGIGKAAEELRISVIGGDTVKSKTLFFDMALIGESSGFMLRSCARPGDLVGVTGTFGDSRGGLELLSRGKISPKYLINRFLSPQARIREGKEALRLGVKCGTDVSDGLLFNIWTISASSRVRIDVEREKIPISQELIDTFGREKALEFALYGGEDYELVITFPEKLTAKLEELGFKVIGEVKKGSGVFLDGKEVKVSGYDHFKEEK